MAMLPALLASPLVMSAVEEIAVPLAERLAATGLKLLEEYGPPAARELEHGTEELGTDVIHGMTRLARSVTDVFHHEPADHEHGTTPHVSNGLYRAHGF